MKEKDPPHEIVELNDGYFHEALDRVYCFQDSFDRLIIDHPAIMQTPDLKQLADEIQDKLGCLYQLCGQKFE